MEVIVFALTLVVAQIVGWFVIFKLCMNPKFIKKAMKDYFELIEEITDDFNNM